MPNVRRHLILIALVGAAAFSGCGRPEHAGLPPDVRRELDHGRTAAESWISAARTGGEVGDEAVIGLGYVERLRLGLGSPFRLVEMAQRDPRLSEEARHEVGWALLARTVSGEAYEIDPIALDRAGAGSLANWPGLGRHHLRLIESAIEESRDPRAGELAVRLAYRMAIMEGSLPRQAGTHATRVAALIRDRELARADVVRLLRSAEAAQGDPLRAIARWRAERWLRVELPAMETLPPDVEREALELAPRLAQTLRMLGARLGDITSRRASAPDVNPSLLTPAVAQRLAAIVDSLQMPPQAPVAIATRTYQQELTQQPWLTEQERQKRAQLTRVQTEERLAATYAMLDRSSPHDAAPSLMTLWAAVALRTHAQEPVWFPGFGGPTTREVEERFGLAAVRFGEEVPAEWRPYYRGKLESALLDMQRVLPALDTRGLTVRFTATRRGDATLAMHDPKARELVLPPGSSAGTVAHEIAHDLDWQVALRRYRVRGDYASDRVSRQRTGDRLAARIRELDLTATLDALPADERTHGHAHRPAENFARAVDWFVAASLASQGRTNGYLSSVQDDALTGYGTVRPPDISGRAGDALINILDEVAPLYPETRDWFLRTYGSARAQSAFDLIRGIMEVDLAEPSPAGALSGIGNADVIAAFSEIEAARVRGLRAIDEWACRAPGGAPDRGLEQARRNLVVEAAAARARGVALQHARRLNGDAGLRWVARQLYGGPWSTPDVDEAMQELLEPLVEEARNAGRIVMPPTGPSFDLLALPSHCSPLALR